MDKRKLTLLLLLCFSLAVRSQQSGYQQTDSTSYAQYLAADWPELIRFAKAAIRNGDDFPLLRQRLAYAYFARGNYGESLAQWQKALQSDQHNQDARYYAYLCNRFLNRPAGSGYDISFLEDSILNLNRVKRTGLTGMGAEYSLKSTSLLSRGNGSYFRIFGQWRLPERFMTEQSVSLFNQQIFNASNLQLDYFGQISYVPVRNLAITGGYHYFNTTSLQTSYSNHNGLFSLKFSQPFLDISAGISVSSLNSATVTQADEGLKLYPAGNLNAYLGMQISQVHQQGSPTVVTGGSIGGKLAKKIWAEGSGVFGGLKNYYDAGGLYLYNSIDDTRYKAGATAWYLLSASATFSLSYFFERKDIYNQQSTYNQQSLSGGITWKF